ncbi:MAG: hypothetical protein ACOYN6_03110 [Ignavibacteria bacterium]
MKQRLLVTAVLLISIFCGLSYINAQEKLKITDLDAAFKFIEKNKAYDKVTDVIEYESVDEAPYDKVFKSTAVINGLVKQVNFGLDEITSGPKELIPAIQKIVASGFVFSTKFNITDLDKAIETIDDYQSLNGSIKDLKTKIKFYFATISFTQDLITNGPSKISSLLSSAQGLNPVKDFTGFSARKIPNVAGALKTSIENLGSAGTEIGKMAAKLTGLGF